MSQTQHQKLAVTMGASGDTGLAQEERGKPDLPCTALGLFQGTVHKWVTKKGFGFITPDGVTGGGDVFVHRSAFRGGHLTEGGRVSYDLKCPPRPGLRACAVNVSGSAVGPTPGFVDVKPEEQEEQGSPAAHQVQHDLRMAPRCFVETEGTNVITYLGRIVSTPGGGKAVIRGICYRNLQEDRDTYSCGEFRVTSDHPALDDDTGVWKMMKDIDPSRQAQRVFVRVLWLPITGNTDTLRSGGITLGIPAGPVRGQNWHYVDFNSVRVEGDERTPTRKASPLWGTVQRPLPWREQRLQVGDVPGRRILCGKEQEKESNEVRHPKGGDNKRLNKLMHMANGNTQTKTITWFLLAEGQWWKVERKDLDSFPDPAFKLEGNTNATIEELMPQILQRWEGICTEFVDKLGLVTDWKLQYCRVGAEELIADTRWAAKPKTIELFMVPNDAFLGRMVKQRDGAHPQWPVNPPTWRMRQDTMCSGIEAAAAAAAAPGVGDLARGGEGKPSQARKRAGKGGPDPARPSLDEKREESKEGVRTAGGSNVDRKRERMEGMDVDTEEKLKHNTPAMAQGLSQVMPKKRRREDGRIDPHGEEDEVDQQVRAAYGMTGDQGANQVVQDVMARVVQLNLTDHSQDGARKRDGRQPPKDDRECPTGHFPQHHMTHWPKDKQDELEEIRKHQVPCWYGGAGWIAPRKQGVTVYAYCVLDETTEEHNEGVMVDTWSRDGKLRKTELKACHKRKREEIYTKEGWLTRALMTPVGAKKPKITETLTKRQREAWQKAHLTEEASLEAWRIVNPTIKVKDSTDTWFLQDAILPQHLWFPPQQLVKAIEEDAMKHRVSVAMVLLTMEDKTLEQWQSRVGLVINAEGVITEVLKGSLALKQGLRVGWKLGYVGAKLHSGEDIWNLMVEVRTATGKGVDILFSHAEPSRLGIWTMGDLIALEPGQPGIPGRKANEVIERSDCTICWDPIPTTTKWVRGMGESYEDILEMLDIPQATGRDKPRVYDMKEKEIWFAVPAPHGTTDKNFRATSKPSWMTDKAYKHVTKIWYYHTAPVEGRKTDVLILYCLNTKQTQLVVTPETKVIHEQEGDEIMGDDLELGAWASAPLLETEYIGQTLVEMNGPPDNKRILRRLKDIIASNTRAGPRTYVADMPGLPPQLPGGTFWGTPEEMDRGSSMMEQWKQSQGVVFPARLLKEATTYQIKLSAPDGPNWTWDMMLQQMEGLAIMNQRGNQTFFWRRNTRSVDVVTTEPDALVGELLNKVGELPPGLEMTSGYDGQIVVTTGRKIREGLQEMLPRWDPSQPRGNPGRDDRQREYREHRAREIVVERRLEGGEKRTLKVPGVCMVDVEVKATTLDAESMARTWIRTLRGRIPRPDNSTPGVPDVWSITVAPQVGMGLDGFRHPVRGGPEKKTIVGYVEFKVHHNGNERGVSAWLQAHWASLAIEIDWAGEMRRQLMEGGGPRDKGQDWTGDDLEWLPVDLRTRLQLKLEVSQHRNPRGPEEAAPGPGPPRE